MRIGPKFARLEWLRLAASSSAVLWCSGADATEHEVRTRGVQWVPNVVFVAPGDTVVWRGMLGHETALVEPLRPSGSFAWSSALGEEGFRVTVERPGIYVYVCQAHANAGMVGAIIAGDGPHDVTALEAELDDVAIGRAFMLPLLAKIKRELRNRGRD